MSTEALLTKQDKELQQEIREFVASIPRNLLLAMDSEQVVYPRQFLEQAGTQNLLGLRFGKEWGGRNLPWTSEMVALEEIGVLGTSLACLYSLVSIVGEAVHTFGTTDQKQKYLLPMIRGEIGVAEGLTEPRGGSDFFGATTSARREGDTFYLNGQKRFIVGAQGADLFMVYARVEGIEDPKKGITAFLVRRGETVQVHHVYGLMGTRGGGTGRIVFKNTPVSVEDVLGGENGIGRGSEVFNRMMIPERMTSAGGAIGMARSGLEIATRYADRRKAFGQKIRKFEGVSFKIAESITLLDAARALNYIVAAAIDTVQPAEKVRRLVSESKKFATETAWTIINHAMQILGGIGYTNIYPVERLLRDVRLLSIWTGTNEIMNLIIQHEFYHEFREAQSIYRDIEADAEGADFVDEKVYE